MVADFFRNISRFYKHFCTCALSGTERPPTHFQDESEGSGLVTPTRGLSGRKYKSACKIAKYFGKNPQPYFLLSWQKVNNHGGNCFY